MNLPKNSGGTLFFSEWTTVGSWADSRKRDAGWIGSRGMVRGVAMWGGGGDVEMGSGEEGLALRRDRPRR